jgi:hypothetical protein
MRTEETANDIVRHWSAFDRSRAIACLTLTVGAVAFELARATLLGFSPPVDPPILSRAEPVRQANVSLDAATLELWSRKRFAEMIEKPVVVPVKVQAQGAVGPDSARVATVSPAAPAVLLPAAPAPAAPLPAAPLPEAASPAEVDETASIPLPPRMPQKIDKADEVDEIEEPPPPRRGRSAKTVSPKPDRAPRAVVRQASLSPRPQAPAPSREEETAGQAVATGSAANVAPSAPAPQEPAVSTSGDSITLKVPADVRIRGRDSFQLGGEVYRLDSVEPIVPKRVLGPRRDLRKAIAGETLTCKGVKNGASTKVVSCTKSKPSWIARNFPLW